MRKHERERERVDKVKYTDGMVCRDQDIRTYMKIMDTVHDRGVRER